MNQEYVRKLLKKPFVRVGIPFLSTIVASSFVFKELMQAKLDIRAERATQSAQPVKGEFLERVATDEEREQLRQNIQKVKEAWEEEEAKRQAEKATKLRWQQENWKNLRGPRDGEDELGMQNEQRAKLGLPPVQEKEGALKYKSLLTIKAEDL